jgi:hypothetical protein
MFIAKWFEALRAKRRKRGRANSLEFIFEAAVSPHCQKSARKNGRF